MKWAVITIIILYALLLLLLNAFEIKLKDKWKKANGIFVCILFILIVELFIWNGVQGLVDYIAANIILIIFFVLGYFSSNKIRVLKKNIYTQFTVSLIGVWSLVTLINIYFIRPIPNYIWIINFALFWLRRIYDLSGKKFNWNRKAIAYVAVHILVLIAGLNYFYEDSFYGTTRSIQRVKDYLIERERYKEESIDYMYNLKLEKGKPEPVVVRFNNGEERYFEYFKNNIKEITHEESIKFHY